MTKPTVQFGEYTLRGVDEDDRRRIEDWIVQDQDHREQFTANDFIEDTRLGEDEPHALCYVLADRIGDVFFLRLSRAARVRIQFGPNLNKSERYRSARAMLHGMAFLEGMLQHLGVEEWIFDTANPELAAFATARLGFTASTNELKRPISSPTRQNAQGGALADTGNV